MIKLKYPLIESLGLRIKTKYSKGPGELAFEEVVSADDLECMLEKGVKVYMDKKADQRWRPIETHESTHSGLLINIQPIQPLTLEEKLSAILKDHSKSVSQALEEIRKLLESK
jgi:hypothetical protein